MDAIKTKLNVFKTKIADLNEVLDEKSLKLNEITSECERAENELMEKRMRVKILEDELKRKKHHIKEKHDKLHNYNSNMNGIDQHNKKLAKKDNNRIGELEDLTEKYKEAVESYRNSDMLLNEAIQKLQSLELMLIQKSHLADETDKKLVDINLGLTYQLKELETLEQIKYKKESKEEQYSEEYSALKENLEKLEAQNDSLARSISKTRLDILRKQKMLQQWKDDTSSLKSDLKSFLDQAEDL